MNSELVKQIIRALWVALIMTATVLAIYITFPLVYPFVIGWLIAYMLNPAVNLLERKAKFPRWLASTISLLLFLGALITGLTLIISKLVIEINKLVQMINNNINAWIESLVNYVESAVFQNLLNQIYTIYNQNEQFHDTIESNLFTYGEKISTYLTTLITDTVGFGINIAASLPNFALIIIVIMLAAFFISKDYYKHGNRLSTLLPEGLKKTSGGLWDDLKRALFGYVRAQLIMISITATFIIIGLLVLNVKYAFTIGLLIGFVDLLPYLGVGAVMVPWIIIVFIQGNIGLGIGLSILYGIVVVTRTMVEPKVLATSIGLGALSTLIAMFVGLKLFGFIGVIIGPVSLVILVAVYRAHLFHDLKQYIQHGWKPTG